MKKINYSVWVKLYVKKYWYLIIFLLLIACVSVAFELATPLPLKFLADNVFGNLGYPAFLPDNKPALLIMVGVAYVLLYGLQNIYSAVQSYLTRLCSQKIDIDSLMTAYDAAIGTPYNHPSRHTNGTYLYQITSQSQQMSEFILINFVFIIQSLVGLVGVITILVAVKAGGILITFITFPIIAILVVRFGKVLQKRANDTETAHAKVYAYIEESLAKLRTVQSFVLHNIRATKLRQLLTIRNRFALRQLTTSQSYFVVIELFILISIACTIVIGGQGVLAGTLTLGGLLVLIAYTNNVFSQVSNIVDTIGSMKVQSASLEQAYDMILAAPNDKSHHPTSHGIALGKIEFDNVTLSRGTQTVVENFSMTINPGSIVALVGASGSGKTTILNSLLGFVQPSRGWVRLDGSDIVTYDLDDVRRSIALIEQEPDLFDGTFSENIVLADPTRQFSALEVASAANLSNSKEFIEALPEQYETLINDTVLSGGQKQRLAIARALYKKAPIILMDEPTSALDSHSAQLFIDTLLRYFGGRTIVIVTHELSLLKKIPNIYVVKDRTVKPIAEYGGLEEYARQLQLAE